MKFFRFKKRDSVLEAINQIEKSIDESIDFTDTMFSDIAEMKLKLENIKSEEEIYASLRTLIEDLEKYIQKSTEVIEERKIEEKLQRVKESNTILEINQNPQISEATKDSVNQELTIEEYYTNIKSVYEAKYKKATQAIIMRKLEKFNNDMDKLIFDWNKLNTINEEELNTYFQILKARKEEFTGIMQNKYIERLIEVEYKIEIIKMIIGIKKNSYNRLHLTNQFETKAKMTNGKQIIWSRLFIIGIQDFIEKSSSDYSEGLREELEKINLKDKREEILNSALISKYIGAIINMQMDEQKKQQDEKERVKKEQEDREKKEQEEKQKQELEKELEQFRELTPKQIEDKIAEIDDDTFDIVTSYKNIMDYQIKVAKSKGLINERDILEIDDIKIQRIAKQKIPNVLENLKDEICNCEIYTDIDDSNKDVYVVLPKKVQKDLSENIDNRINTGYTDKNTYYRATKDFMGIFSKYYAKDREIVSFDFRSNTIRCNGVYRFIIEDEIKRIKQQWEEDNKDNVNRIKFYIEIPYRRTIIPILEKLHKNKIKFTIPPTDKKTKMNNPTVRIYMNREDLEKYKEQVHRNISNSEEGIVIIGEEKIDIGELLIDGCEFEFLKDKNQETVK